MLSQNLNDKKSPSYIKWCLLDSLLESDIRSVIAAFMKQCLLKKCALRHLDPEKKTNLSVDASNQAVGGMLMQAKNDSEELHPVCYFSYISKKYQKSYTTTEKETLAIVIGVCKFQHYLEGIHFIIETDHHALCQFPKFNFTLGQLHRWSIELSSYDYEIQYLKRKSRLADCFSRNPNEWTNQRLCIDDDLPDLIEDLTQDKVYEENEQVNKVKIAFIERVKN